MTAQKTIELSTLAVSPHDHNIVIQPFGAYPLTGIQYWIRRVFFDTPFGYMRFRRPFIEKFKQECIGPVDSYLFGLKVRFYPRDNQTDAKSVVCGNCYNAKEWRWLNVCLPVGGVFVDIGANMGFFSLFAATKKAKIIAIEPQPILFDRLSTNMFLNNIDACLVNVAVGEREETGSLIQTNKDYGSGMIGQGEGETVRIRPLLDILTESQISHIDVLKIDIEGYEDRALLPFLNKAPDSLLPKHIIMEYSERDRWQTDLLGKLVRIGYQQKAHSRGNALMSRN